MCPAGPILPVLGQRVNNGILYSANIHVSTPARLWYMPLRVPIHVVYTREIYALAKHVGLESEWWGGTLKAIPRPTFYAHGVL